MRSLTNKELKLYILIILHKSTQTKLVVWVLLKGTLKLVPLNTPAYDRSSEDEEIGPIDLALLISCLITPIVTAPAEDEDEAEDRVQDRVEDRVGDKDGDEDDSPPVMVTDESLSNEDVRLTAEEVEHFLNEWRSSADYVALSPVGAINVRLVLPKVAEGDFFKNLTDLYRTNSKLDGKIINIGGDHSMAISTILDTRVKP